MKHLLAIAAFFCLPAVFAGAILVPMDTLQTDHLKAYGIVYRLASTQQQAAWLLNYRGGSFLLSESEALERELSDRGVRFEKLSTQQETELRTFITRPGMNARIVPLNKKPKIAVYTSGHGFEADQDPVMAVLDYAGIPYDKLYDDEILSGELARYDWLHVQHEDFTGQYGKFFAFYGQDRQYIENVSKLETTAMLHGFSKVSQLKRAVADTIRDFIAGGGFLMAMCGSTDSYDIALAAHRTDICAEVYDCDGIDPQCQEKLDFGKTLAFGNFRLERDPMVYEFSTIDGASRHHGFMAEKDPFMLYPFRADEHPEAAALTQCHTDTLPGFMGQTTDFQLPTIKPGVTILAGNKAQGTARMIHGQLGAGCWTFYGGHDPEDYQHRIGDPPTDLSKHPDSPGYRLILNNVLFRAADLDPRR